MKKTYFAFVLGFMSLATACAPYKPLEQAASPKTKLPPLKLTVTSIAGKYRSDCFYSNINQAHQKEVRIYQSNQTLKAQTVTYSDANCSIKIKVETRTSGVVMGSEDISIIEELSSYELLPLQESLVQSLKSDEFCGVPNWEYAVSQKFENTSLDACSVKKEIAQAASLFGEVGKTKDLILKQCSSGNVCDEVVYRSME